MTRRSDPNPAYWEQYGPFQHVNHELIRCYLNGWYPKLGTWARRVLYVDTHAGRVGHGSAEENNFFRDDLSLGSSSAAGVDLAGGVQLPISGHTAFRGELHIHVYAGGSAAIVVGGLSFRLN